MTVNRDKYLSTREAADQLGCSLRTIHRRIKDGTLKAARRPRSETMPRWFVSKHSVERLLKKRRAS